MRIAQILSQSLEEVISAHGAGFVRGGVQKNVEYQEESLRIK